MSESFSMPTPSLTIGLPSQQDLRERFVLNSSPKSWYFVVSNKSQLTVSKEFLLDPYQYQYWNPGFQRNFGLPKTYPGQYSTDLVAEKALGFLDDAVKEPKPFFLTIAPTAPHGNFNVTVDPWTFSYNLTKQNPMPATRHLGLFTDAKVPRTKNFNPDKVRIPNSEAILATET